MAPLHWLLLILFLVGRRAAIPRMFRLLLFSVLEIGINNFICDQFLNYIYIFNVVCGLIVQ
jgi:hypothetical protein